MNMFQNHKLIPTFELKTESKELRERESKELRERESKELRERESKELRERERVKGRRGQEEKVDLLSNNQ